MILGVDSTTVTKAIAVIVLYLFLPLSVVSYYFTRRPRRVAEVERTLSILKLGPAYREAFAIETVRYYVWAVTYASLVALMGLTLMFFSRELGLAGEMKGIQIGAVHFPQTGSIGIFGLAFFGAYLWSLQHVFRRYSLNDLVPAVYYNISIRMLLAGTIAFVIYNAASALAGQGTSDGGVSDLTNRIWPALAFMIGMFPARGVRYLTDRVTTLSSTSDSSTRSLPLEMIEGIEMHDVLRLEELGIDSCFDLAVADFAPLALRTPYSPRQLINWILQAKLCVHFGDSVTDLRQRGIRSIADLDTLTTEEFEKLAAETTATRFTLDSARDLIKNDTELKRLRELALVLGRFWALTDELELVPVPESVPAVPPPPATAPAPPKQMSVLMK